MMTIPVALQSLLDTGATTLCAMWKISLTNLTFKYYTDLDVDVPFVGNTYIAASGFSRTAIRKTEGISSDNLDISGYVLSSFISEGDILSGLYDGATVEVFFVDYKNPAAGSIQWFYGVVSDIKVDRGKFTLSCDGLTARLKKAFGEVTSPDCRARLGDNRCQKSLVGLTMTGAVTVVTSRTLFSATLSGVPSVGFFDYGKIVFSSGQNSGKTFEVKTVVGPSPYQISIQLPASLPLAIGDAFTATAGCDGAFTTCINKFSNAINFVGEPHSPGVDKTMARGNI